MPSKENTLFTHKKKSGLTSSSTKNVFVMRVPTKQLHFSELAHKSSTIEENFNRFLLSYGSYYKTKTSATFFLLFNK